MTSDEQSIRDTIAAWIRASEDGDVPGALAILADDVIFLTPDRPPFGKTEFGAAGAGPPGLKVSAEVLEVHGSGDWAWTRCFVKVSVPSADGSVMKLEGQTLSIWSRAGSRWVIRRDANFVKPAP